MKIRQLLSVGQTEEAIFIFARPFILSFLPWLAIGFLLVLFGLFFAFFIPSAFPNIVATPFQFDVFVVMLSSYFLLIIPFFTVGFIDFYYDLLVVTDRRIMDIDQNSLFSRSFNELALEQVEDVSASTNGILRTLFDFGDVTIQSAGAKEKFIFKGVAHPRQITDIILDLADQAKQRIERGPRALMPSGNVKGVIENKIYTSTDSMYQIGALVHNHSAANHIPLPNPVITPGMASSPRSDDDIDIVIDDNP